FGAQPAKSTRKKPAVERKLYLVGPDSPERAGPSTLYAAPRFAVRCAETNSSALHYQVLLRHFGLAHEAVLESEGVQGAQGAVWRFRLSTLSLGGYCAVKTK